MQDGVTQSRVKHGRSPVVPIGLVAVTLLVLVGFQTVQLSKERASLTKVKENQQSALNTSKNVRGQLDSIAKGIAQLAAQGNVNAKVVVEQLQRQGIRINTNDARPSKRP